MQQEGDNATSDLFELFGDPISTYTRAQAIEDGVLVDLMVGDMADVARQHYKHPVACTRGVFDIVKRAVNNPRWGNDYAGILHDILWMSRVAVKRQPEASRVLFVVIINGAGRQTRYVLQLVIGPGDAGEPVITIMLPNED